MVLPHTSSLLWSSSPGDGTVKAVCLSAPRIAQLHYSLQILPSASSPSPQIFLGNLLVPWPDLLCTDRYFHSGEISLHRAPSGKWESQKKEWDTGEQSMERTKPQDQLLIRNETWSPTWRSSDLIQVWDRQSIPEVMLHIATYSQENIFDFGNQTHAPSWTPAVHQIPFQRSEGQCVWISWKLESMRAKRSVRWDEA